MFSALTLFLIAIAATRTAATPCVAMDAEFNLLAFGFGGKDYNAGQQSTWTSAESAVDISTSGRPPFDGDSQCFLAQFFNSIYVLGADKACADCVYIYDAAAKSWSRQSTTPGSFDFGSYTTILDRDTNVFYALSKGSLYSLPMAELKAATSSALEWNAVGTTPLPAGYEPTIALAQNHIHALGLPNVEGAEIFVIHFSYWQPETQTYPVNGGGAFPNAHGKTVSLFQAESVQEEFAYIPDGGSNTYIMNVATNTSQALAYPTTKDSAASYFASTSAIVQFSTTGGISFIPYAKADAAANAAAKWSPVTILANVASAGSTSGSNAPNSPSGSGKGGVSPTGSGSKTGSAATGSQTGGGGSAQTGAGWRNDAAHVLMAVTAFSGLLALLL